MQQDNNDKMEQTVFYQTLMEKYSQINIPVRWQEVSKLEKYISWYLADFEQSIICVEKKNLRYIIEIDITRAFPTICNNIFDSSSEFVTKMNNISEKKGKNIFISTTLKGPILKQLNNMCKIIIIGILFDVLENEDILLLEIKKDGCIFGCTKETIHRLNNLMEFGKDYSKFLINNNFQFHIKSYSHYIRSNKTSIFIEDMNEKMTIKGIYKYFPKKLEAIIFKILAGEKINMTNLLNIYSKKYWNIIKSNMLTEFLENYYICGEDKLLNYEGKYQKFNNLVEVDPRLYLRLFVFPSILFKRINMN